jgi:hypothetical protein
MSNESAMKQAQQYLERYRQAQTRQERRSVAIEYKTFFNSLSDQEQLQAQGVMDSLWPDINQKVSELEHLTEQIQSVLKPKVALEK